MKNDKIVSINGQDYDSTTGMPITKAKSVQNQEKNSDNNIHSLAHRSNKIRSYNPQKILKDIKSPIRKIGQRMDISRSKSISHFAKQTDTIPKKSNPTKKRMDLKPFKHSVAANTEKMNLIPKKQHSMVENEASAKIVKQQPVNEVVNKTSKNINSKNNFYKRNSTAISIFSICAVLLIILGYLTYINFPTISVRIASFQAGIKASYPEYSPEGYSVDGPISYTNDKVTIKFRAKTGSSKFVINQTKSSWDSSAVKIQADKESNNQTSESQEGGLTIYTYSDNTAAIWVNGGILYTISGNAKLTGEQIRHIATSL